MRWDAIFLGFLSLMFIASLFLYWVFPTQIIEFSFDRNPNFNLNESSPVQMQFYENMRFPSPKISYKIDRGCNLEKQGNMKRAFEILENETILEFYAVEKEEEISISCDDENKVNEGMFIAGEGGPVNISAGENFNVISAGQILLIRNSNCERPNVAIHELLHVLGFNHSENSNNIMYPVSKCRQTIGEDIISKINELYSFPREPDLKFQEADAIIKGLYMDLNISIKNDGLVKANVSNLVIYADNKKIKEIEIEELSVGYEVRIMLSNILVSQFNVNNLSASIESNFNEISKENNQIFLTKQLENN